MALALDRAVVATDGLQEPIVQYGSHNTFFLNNQYRSAASKYNEAEDHWNPLARAHNRLVDLEIAVGAGFPCID